MQTLYDYYAWRPSKSSYRQGRKLIYLYSLFEETALYYAYQHALFTKAEKIIRNGYDHYLELATLYLIYCHDLRSYWEYMNDLR
ncbi:MAG: hypothetical protein VZR27_09165 [Acutalibacteraceae bacterium]|nr:hypothetical protein [Acutalibacteraceae bacterium]